MKYASFDTILFIFLFLGLILINSCKDDSAEEPEIITEWTVSGTAELKGTPVADIKLAAFYNISGCLFGLSSILVSNVFNIRTTTVSDFVLNINTTGIGANNGDTVDLIMWEDVNNNDLYDEEEYFQYTEPLANCPVFENAVKCCFFYASKDDDSFNVSRGWNVDIGYLNSVSIESAVLESSRITNWYNWEDIVTGAMIWEKLQQYYY